MTAIRLETQLAGRASAILALLTALGATAHAQAPVAMTRVNHANWELANKFGTEALRRVTFSTSVQPHWLGKTDSLWYNWKDHNGSTFFLIVPATKVKRPLFDHTKLAAALAIAHRKPYDPQALPFTTVTFTRDHKRFRFNVDTGTLATRYEWNLAGEALTRLGRPPRADSIPPDEEREEQQEGGRGGGGGGRAGGPGQADFRNWSPDSSMFVFARNHNLFLVEKGKADTVQISTDGERNHTFGFRDTTQVQQDTTQEEQGGQQGGRGGNRDPRVRANITWSPDSKAFSITRQDQRKVKELYLVNVLAEPRPALSSYSYAMPGEENVAQMELYIWKKGDPKVSPVDVKKWRDERLVGVHWTTGSDKLRLVRRDRPQRTLELIEVDLATKAIKPIYTESVESANLEAPNIRYTKGGGDMIIWSERSGWGHFYLYDHNGTYKRQLTEGTWRADQIVAIDTVGGVIWVSGVGREPGENVYYRHTYRMNAD